MSDKPRAMRFDRGFQQSIIQLMLKDHQFCHRACSLLEPGHFADRLSWFFTTISEWYEDHGQIITKEGIAADILKQPTDKQQGYYDDLNEIFAITLMPEKIKAEMTMFVRCNIFVEAATKAAAKYNNSKQDDAFAYIRDRIEALHNANFESDPNTHFGDVNAVLAASMEQNKNAIKTGLLAIDEQIGGLLPGTFTVWLGASNAGKSMLGPAMAKQAAKEGKRTFVTIHEDEEIPTKIRYLACFADIEINKLSYAVNTLTAEEWTRLDEADKKLQQFVTLRFMYTTEATIENVMDVARARMREWPFDLFVCDYGQCLTSRTTGARQEMRHLHEHIYHMLKQLCLELKIAGTGGAQVNRNGMAMNRAGSEFLRCTDVSEAYGIIKKATNVITINRSNEDVINNRIVFLLDKARNGKCPIAVECVSDFAKGMAYRPDAQQNQVSVAGGPGVPSDDEMFEADKKKKTKSYA